MRMIYDADGLKYTILLCILVDKVNKLVAAEKQTAAELLLHLEGAVRDSVERRGITRFVLTVH